LNNLDVEIIAESSEVYFGISYTVYFKASQRCYFTLSLRSDDGAKFPANSLTAG